MYRLNSVHLKTTLMFMSFNCLTSNCLEPSFLSLAISFANFSSSDVLGKKHINETEHFYIIPAQWSWCAHLLYSSWYLASFSRSSRSVFSFRRLESNCLRKINNYKLFAIK